ncbi:MAG: 3-oxoacyl-ACP reductase FabG [Saprospiraceae bacterium]
MKFALVTGGSRGIGRAVCQKLADAGYNILINYRSQEEEANQTKSLVEASGQLAELLPFDVSNKESVEANLGKWIEDHPEDHIEILVNNAGIRQDALMFWMEESQWKDVLGSNLDGFFYVTKKVLQGMISKRYGRIVNVVSVSGLKGMAGQVNYSAAKAGMIGATKALSQEIARKGITVNAVAPGFIQTDMTKDLDESQLKSLIPMQRFGKADEVADAIVFLASPQASYITGVVLPITGGLS